MNRFLVAGFALANVAALFLALGWDLKLGALRLPRLRRPARPGPGRFDTILAESVEPPPFEPAAPRMGIAEARLAENLERWRRGGRSAAGTPVPGIQAATPCRPRRKPAAPRAKAAPKKAAPRRKSPGTAVEAPATVEAAS